MIFHPTADQLETMLKHVDEKQSNATKIKWIENHKWIQQEHESDMLDAFDSTLSKNVLRNWIWNMLYPLHAATSQEFIRHGSLPRNSIRGFINHVPLSRYIDFVWFRIGLYDTRNRTIPVAAANEIQTLWIKSSGNNWFYKIRVSKQVAHANATSLYHEESLIRWIQIENLFSFFQTVFVPFLEPVQYQILLHMGMATLPSVLDKVPGASRDANLIFLNKSNQPISILPGMKCQWLQHTWSVEWNSHTMILT